MKYFIEDLKAMAFDERDPFALFINEKVNIKRHINQPEAPAWVIKVEPSTDITQIHDHFTYYDSSLTCTQTLRNIYAVQLDGLLRVPKGSATFTIYNIVNRKDPRFIIVQNEDGQLTYHVSVDGECRVTTCNQARDPLQYIVVQTDTGLYQLAEVVSLDARHPVTKDRIGEVEARYPLTNFDPEYQLDGM